MRLERAGIVKLRVKMACIIDIPQVQAFQLPHFIVQDGQNVAPSASVAEVDVEQAEVVQLASVSAEEGDEVVGAESPALDAECAETFPVDPVEDLLEWEIQW